MGTDIEFHRCADPAGETLRTFAILTTAANDDMAQLHDIVKKHDTSVVNQHVERGVLAMISGATRLMSAGSDTSNSTAVIPGFAAMVGDVRPCPRRDAGGARTVFGIGGIRQAVCQAHEAVVAEVARALA